MTDAIVPRPFDVDLSAVPRHWMAGNPTATALANGINMLFPHGERYFVRSVKYFLRRIDDPELRGRMRGFFGQEAFHASAHDHYNDVMRAQGYEIDELLAAYRRGTDWLEARTSPELRLAVTAAAEHFTAILAVDAFEVGALDRAVPEMRALLAWHAAEELEHKAVAFDVLQRIDPSYALRLRGLALATLILFTYWGWGTIRLLRQDRRSLRQILDDVRALRRPTPLPALLLRGIRDYARRDFHPNQRDDRHVAARWFAARGMALPAAA